MAAGVQGHTPIQHCTTFLLQVDFPSNLFSRVRKPSLKAPTCFPHVSSVRTEAHAHPCISLCQENGISSMNYYLFRILPWAGKRVTFSWMVVTRSKSVLFTMKGEWRSDQQWLLLLFYQLINLLLLFPSNITRFLLEQPDPLLWGFTVHLKWFSPRRGVYMCMSSAWSHF